MWVGCGRDMGGDVGGASPGGHDRGRGSRPLSSLSARAGLLAPPLSMALVFVVLSSLFFPF